MVSDTMVGRVSRYWQSEETRWPSVGVALFAPGDWGNGLGPEALNLWCDYLFGSMPGIARFELRT